MDAVCWVALESTDFRYKSTKNHPKALIIQGFYGSLPKGHIEDGETKIECAIRECYEETGIILEPSSYVKSLDSYTIKFTNNKLEEVEKKVYPLLFKIMKKEVPKIKEPRILETNFISIEEFLNQCSYDNVKNIILSLMNDI